MWIVQIGQVPDFPRQESQSLWPRRPRSAESVHPVGQTVAQHPTLYLPSTLAPPPQKTDLITGIAVPFFPPNRAHARSSAAPLDVPERRSTGRAMVVIRLRPRKVPSLAGNGGSALP